MKEKLSVPVTFRIPEKEFQRLKKHSDRLRLSMSFLGRRSLEKFNDALDAIKPSGNGSVIVP